MSSSRPGGHLASSCGPRHTVGDEVPGPARRGGSMTLEQTESGRADLRAKGLSKNSVGLLASVVLGVSSIAPVYALTATLGPTVTEVGLQMPAIFLAGFL